jgi:GNAT superfamily N-acetyltransferase
MIVELSLDESLIRFARTEFEKKLIGYPFAFARTHFIHEEKGRILGRISANLSLRDPERGYIGMFDCDATAGDSVASALIQAAECWLASKGVSRVYGPVNYSTFFDYRFEIARAGMEENFPFFWEPRNPTTHPKAFLQNGYQIADEYFSRAFHRVQLILPVSQHRYDEALKAGFSTRTIDLSGNAAHELKMLSKINAGSFEESFIAEAFDEQLYRALIAPQYFSRLSEYTFFILNPAGEEIGYFFLFVENGYLVWKTVAILPEYQGAGLASFGIHHALQLALRNGVDKLLAALIRIGAPSEVLLNRAKTLQIWEHRYAVFEKTFKST